MASECDDAAAAILLSLGSLASLTLPIKGAKACVCACASVCCAVLCCAMRCCAVPARCLCLRGPDAVKLPGALLGPKRRALPACLPCSLAGSLSFRPVLIPPPPSRCVAREPQGSTIARPLWAVVVVGLLAVPLPR